MLLILLAILGLLIGGALAFGLKSNRSYDDEELTVFLGGASVVLAVIITLVVLVGHVTTYSHGVKALNFQEYEHPTLVRSLDQAYVGVIGTDGTMFDAARFQHVGAYTDLLSTVTNRINKHNEHVTSRKHWANHWLAWGLYSGPVDELRQLELPVR
jgi:hypothetical protein